MDKTHASDFHSTLDEKLIASYRETQYKIFTEYETIVVHIDQYSPPIKSLLTTLTAHSATIISAYNPYSQLQNAEQNTLANKLLSDFLTKNDYHFLEGANIDPTEAWPPEKSFLVLNLEPNTAESIGQKFNQNSIVWIDQSAIARLILLR